MENSPLQRSGDISGGKLLIGILWVVSIVATGLISYTVGQGEKPVEQKKDETNVLGSVAQLSPITSSAPKVSDPPVQTPACEKGGYAQKWEFLRSYTVKQGDTLQDIAKSELGDEGRVNEILRINGVGPLVVGSTLYLPPENVTKSSGNLKQVYGKLMEKNASMWHLSFNENEKGMGILIPTYWFDKQAEKDTYQVGECLTILLDDGNTVYSVERQ